MPDHFRLAGREATSSHSSRAPMLEQLEPRLRLSADHSFVQGPEISVGDKPYGIITADFNGDGLPDLAVTNSNDYSVSVATRHKSFYRKCLCLEMPLWPPTNPPLFSL